MNTPNRTPLNFDLPAMVASLNAGAKRIEASQTHTLARWAKFRDELESARGLVSQRLPVQASAHGVTPISRAQKQKEQARIANEFKAITAARARGRA